MQLESVDDTNLSRFQPAWATRAQLLTRLGDTTAAADAYRGAIRLCTAPAVREYLARQVAAT